MKKNLEILGVEDTKEGRPRVTAAGKSYARIKTSEGWMSCFNSVATTALKEFIDKTACVEVTQAGDFSNITKCYGDSESDAVNFPDEKPEVVKVESPKSNNKNTTMYTSYAKDVFCTLLEKDISYSDEKTHDASELMKKSIELVKQAKEAFE